METKDFSHDYLVAHLVKIINYDILELNIEYPNSIINKECILFRVSKNNISEKFSKDLLKHLTSLLKEGDKVKIKVLDERRSRGDFTKELVIVLTDDGKTNINDQMIRYFVDYIENNRLSSIISKIRTCKLGL